MLGKFHNYFEVFPLSSNGGPEPNIRGTQVYFKIAIQGKEKN
jgi:hypothetical protein